MSENKHENKQENNYDNIHGQDGKIYTTKPQPKKRLSLREAIIGIITALLVAHFGAKFFDDGKKELVSMSAITDMQTIIQNVKNHYIALGALGSSPKEAFWQVAGVPLSALPWWTVCFDIGLESGKDAKIRITMTQSDFKDDERCVDLYSQPQVQRWFSAPIYITNKNIEF